MFVALSYFFWVDNYRHLQLTNGFAQLGQKEVESSANHFSALVNGLDELLIRCGIFATHLVPQLHCGSIKISFLYGVDGLGRRNSNSPTDAKPQSLAAIPPRRIARHQ